MTCHCALIVGINQQHQLIHGQKKQHEQNQVHSQWFQSEWGFKINGQILTATIKRTYGHYGDIGNYDDRITHGIRINTKEPTKITLFTQVDLGGSTYFTEYKLPKAYKTKQEASLLFTAIGLSNESD